MNTKKTTPRCIIIKLLVNKDQKKKKEKKTLKSSQGQKSQIYCQRSNDNSDN